MSKDKVREISARELLADANTNPKVLTPIDLQEIACLYREIGKLRETRNKIVELHEMLIENIEKQDENIDRERCKRYRKNKQVSAIH